MLGLVARVVGFNIFRFLAYIRDELLIVLGTSSSESALPQLMEKLERLGCSKSVVGLVVPTGYSFNLDGTNIYMTLTSLFIAQALGVELTVGQQVDHSRRRHADLQGRVGRHRRRLHHARRDARRRSIRASRRAWRIVLGVDKFMSECRALTNICGNGVATIVVAWWEGELDRDKLAAGLARRIDPSDVETAITTRVIARPRWTTTPRVPPDKSAASHRLGQPLDALSVAEFDERIALLRAEIERLEQARAAKAASLAAAEDLFKK